MLISLFLILSDYLTNSVIVTSNLKQVNKSSYRNTFFKVNKICDFFKNIP